MALHKTKFILGPLSLLAIAYNHQTVTNTWFDEIKKGDAGAVITMLDAGSDIETKNEWEGTALAEAIWSGKQELIPILLARGANPNTSGQYGTPLCLAIDRWNTIAIRMLMEDPRTDATLARRDGTTPFNVIRFSDDRFNPAMAEMLIKRGAAIDGVNGQGLTPLMRSSWNGAEKWVAFLLKNGARSDLKSPDGETAYMKAAQRGKLAVMKLLKAQGGDGPVLLNRSVEAAPPLSPAQKWALATGAIMNQRAGFSHEALIPPNFNADDKATAIRLLKEQMEVNNGDDLKRVLLALENSSNDQQFVAWYQCQYVNAGHWGVMAGYLPEAEAWSGMLQMSNRLRATFRSWEEVTESYFNGRRRWYRTNRTEVGRQAQKEQPELEYIAKLLLDSKDSNSPWTKNKWALEAPRAKVESSESGPPIPIIDGEWNSPPANCAIKITPGVRWNDERSKGPMDLRLHNGAGVAFSLGCRVSGEAEFTPYLVDQIKTEMDAKLPNIRSQSLNADWVNFHGVRAHQWTDRHQHLEGRPYFSTKLMFVRKGRLYMVTAVAGTPEPFQDPAIAPLLSGLRFLDD